MGKQNNPIETLPVHNDIQTELKNLKGSILPEIENNNSPTESYEKPKETLTYYYPLFEYQINPDFIKKVITKLKENNYTKIIFEGGVDAEGFPNSIEKYDEYYHLFNYLKIRLKHEGITGPEIDPTDTNILNETLSAIRSMDIISHIPSNIIKILKGKKIEFIKKHHTEIGENYRYSRIAIY